MHKAGLKTWGKFVASTSTTTGFLIGSSSLTTYSIHSIPSLLAVFTGFVQGVFHDLETSFMSVNFRVIPLLHTTYNNEE
jgi:hypothetical protein